MPRERERNALSAAEGVARTDYTVPGQLDITIVNPSGLSLKITTTVRTKMISLVNPSGLSPKKRLQLFLKGLNVDHSHIQKHGIYHTVKSVEFFSARFLDITAR